VFVEDEVVPSPVSPPVSSAGLIESFQTDPPELTVSALNEIMKGY